VIERIPMMQGQSRKRSQMRRDDIELSEAIARAGIMIAPMSVCSFPTRTLTTISQKDAR
jgi:hypothetical protein